MFLAEILPSIFQRLPKLAKMHLLSSLFSIQVLRSEEVHSRVSTSRANGSVFDGSYLSYAATRGHHPQVHRRGAVQTFSNPASLSCDSEFSPSEGPAREQKIHRGECREPPPEPCHRYGHCQVSGQDSGYATQQRRRENSSYQENGHRDTLNPHECERYSNI